MAGSSLTKVTLGLSQQGIIGLGVTCELELNAFIDDLLPIQTEPVRRLYSASRHRFKWKLDNVPEILGAESYQQHDKQFASQLCKLYELRGSAVHRAECLIDEANERTGKKQKVPVRFCHVSAFMFAVDDFLKWTEAQRARQGLATARIIDPPIRYTLGAG